jgi:hypothetical protein
LEFAILEAGDCLLDQQGRLLIDGLASHRRLGEPSRNRGPEAGIGSFRQANKLCGEVGVGASDIPHYGFNCAGIRICRDQGLCICPELADLSW